MIRNFVTKLTIVLTFLVVNVASVSAISSSYWKLDMYTPQSLRNTSTVTIDYTVLSTSDTDTFAVDLYQNSTKVDTQNTTKAYGDSGVFSVTLPDGSYDFFVKAKNNNDSSTKTTSTSTVTIDTVAPGAPEYQGKSTSDNQNYTINFVAPSDSDVKEVRIYAAASSEFTADASTQVLVVTVAPNEVVSINYAAPDSDGRFFAMQSFDEAGNYSPLVGDEDAIVIQGTPATTGGAESPATTTTATADNDTDGQANDGDDGAVAGATTGLDDDDGSVLGAFTENGTLSLALLALILAAGIVAFIRRRNQDISTEK